MSNSLIKKLPCPVCGKTAIEKSRLTIGKSKIINLLCGHVMPESSLGMTDYSLIKSTDGKTLMPFQIEGVKFAENANARCLIADEQGLGKTVQACALLSLHKDSLTPAVLVTKTTLKQQWMYEVLKWVDTKKVQVLKSSTDIALPGMDFYVITYDILKTEKVFSLVTIKTIVLDECQAIKNHLSGRAKAVQAIVTAHGIEHILGLSGTPIKNNAGEYFTILNLLSPSRFHSFQSYIRNYCDSYETQFGYKVGGLFSVEHFNNATKDIIIRRTQEEVLPDLFALKQPRKFQHVSFDDPKFKKAYAAKLAELEELFYADDSAENRANQLAVMNMLRQITGAAKVSSCVDYVTDFLLSTERKIAIFVHHHLTADLLEQELNKWLIDGGYDKAVTYRAGDNREAVIKSFSSPNARVLIASTLASGEGFDGLQHLCSDMIMLERQWNPANEEQTEGRIARFGQTKPCNFIYMIASETIDEYFTELVEEKRAIMKETLDGVDNNNTWQTEGLMRELASILVSKGNKKWKL